jgi:hypothetical protein
MFEIAPQNASSQWVNGDIPPHAAVTGTVEEHLSKQVSFRCVSYVLEIPRGSIKLTTLAHRLEPSVTGVDV